MPHSIIERVSIVVPTLNRTEPLRRALASLSRQVLPHDIVVEVLVIDNSANRSAEPVVAAARADLPHELRYISEPVPGVANARNAGVRAAKGRWVAFLDDDEEAGADWIAGHIANLRATGADASFGPVTARAEEGALTPAFADFFSRRIDRPDGSDITGLSALLGTNNSVFERTSCLAGPSMFDVSLNDIGGEDSLLLRQLSGSGKHFAWAAVAGVTEWVPARRLNWGYVRRRRFLSGQIRTFVNHKLSPPQWGAILLWMGIGAVQAAVETVRALALRPVDRERSEIARSKAWGGLGKVFWGSRFRPRLYGSGLVS